jgi:hypothetical protein
LIAAGVPMPFTSYTSTLGPETLMVAQEAFASAWAEILAAPDGYDLQLAHDLLAKRIMQAALEQGERDPVRLKAYALEGFSL